MRRLWNGWHPLSRADRTRVYVDDGAPACVATLRTNLAEVEDDVAQWWGAPVEFETWLNSDHSPHAGRISDTWGALNWTGDWMVAGVDTEGDDS